MTDYIDLIQYGALDLQYAEESFKNGHYNYSAFFAQQGLEKYLKGYMIKFGIFENMAQLGHLQYPKIIEKMINWSKDSIKNEKGNYLTFQQKNIQFLEFIKKILDDVSNSYEKKIIFWKESLGIQLTKHEKNVLEGIESELMKNVTELCSSVSKFFQTDPFETQNVTENNYDIQEKLIIEKMNSIQKNIIESAKFVGYDTTKINQIREEIEKVLEMISYGSGKDSMTKEETKEFNKFLKTWKAIDWMWNVIESYPHGVIGRYPIQIDGKDPILLYKENHEKLWNLIQSIKHTCLQIKETCK